MKHFKTLAAALLAVLFILTSAVGCMPTVVVPTPTQEAMKTEAPAEEIKPTEAVTPEPTEEPTPEPTAEPTPEPDEEPNCLARVMEQVIESTGFETLTGEEKNTCLGAAGFIDGRLFLAYMYPVENEGGFDTHIAFWIRDDNGGIRCLMDEKYELSYDGVNEPLKGGSFFIGKNEAGETRFETYVYGEYYNRQQDEPYVTAARYYSIGQELTCTAELVSELRGSEYSYFVNGTQTDQDGYYGAFAEQIADEYDYEVMVDDDFGEPFGDDYSVLLEKLYNTEGAYPGSGLWGDAETEFLNAYKAEHGVSNAGEFISCVGSEEKPYPDELKGFVNAIRFDLNGDEVPEIVALRVELENGSAKLLAELFAVSSGEYSLKASVPICSMEYCEAAYIYFYKEPSYQTHYYILVDAEGDGAYTGVGFVSAAAFEVTAAKIEKKGDWEVVYGYVYDDIPEGLAVVGAPFAKYCESFDYSAGYDCFLPLCETEHSVTVGSSGYSDREHRLRIAPFDM